MTKDIPGRIQHETGPSDMRRVSGTHPGVLDPTQTSRLLRVPGAKLSFAAFDPLTAYAQDVPDLNKLNINTELYRPKRVVIETAPTGECTWRFVPSARREEGVADEGTWPRVVDLCGELVELTQDQWDIYKLDPLYECLVKATQYFTTVRNVTHYRPPSPRLSGKRQPDSRSPSPSRTMPPPCAMHNKSAFVESESEGEDEEEVESMVTGEEQLLPRHKSTTRPLRKRKEEERQKRREKLHRKMEWFFQNDDNYCDDRVQPPQTSGREGVIPEPGKRKATSALGTSWSPDAKELEEIRLRNTNNTYIVTSNTKRTRIAPPLTTSLKLERKKLERIKLKQRRRVEESEARRWEREKRMINEIMEEVSQSEPGDSSYHDTRQDVPPAGSDSPGDSSMNQTPGEEMFDEEAARRAAIEESRRKLAELERDRPLWEQEARKRRFREEAEEQALRAKAEERKRKEAQMEAETRAKAQEEREREEMKRAQEKNVQRERELREQERRQRQQRWSFGPWTMQRALERYRVLSEAFDNTKFTTDLPLTVDDVPWPVLESPVTFSVEDVSWDRVERFFETIRPHMRFQDYKALVEKSHRRFHPDRWRSRNLLKTVQDEAIRGCMEVAANTVAQALTPLWRSLTGR